MYKLSFILLLLFINTTAAKESSEIHAIIPIPNVVISQPEQVELGEKLFHETRFSSTGKVSCASCHNLNAGGDDDLPTAIGVNGQVGNINSPTVFNSSLNFRQFWDGRALTLFEQVDGPIHNPKEMASSWESVLAVLNDDEEYKSTFDRLFEDGITVKNFRTAVIAFEESLLTPDSRFDLYLKGNKQILTTLEITGYKRFQDYGCISCHQGVAIGGNLFQKLGVIRPFFDEGKSKVSDLGRYNVTKKDNDRYVFKVPSLRNIDMTAPYLHDGSVNKLEDVVKVMMIYQLGMEVEGAEQDIKAIVAFLKTLTGKYNGKLL
jgi:cytochrome c peroxidase